MQKALNCSYLDAFIENGNNLLDNDNVHVENGQPRDEVVKQLKTLYSQVDYSDMASKDVRKAIQMVLIKAITQDKIQSNHQLTPDTIAFIIGYLLTRIFKSQPEIEILDLAVGSGNLLMAIMHQLSSELHATVHGIGIDNDDSMLSIAGISAEMQKLPVELIHQDSINNILVNNVDLVVSDLPVGFYPIDENAKNYVTHSETGHSYAHHLLIEQGMNHVKPGGFGVFLVPSNLFQTKESKSLLKWMQDDAYLQGMLNLPKELFANAATQKAIMILQRHGNGAKQVNKIMIGEFPSFKDQAAFQKFIAEIVDWEQKDLLANS
ncbi:class I SAM-dependent methyltransferase [Nicoliella spurrieriana]|uniref:Class I SAM-dependent methyltransferase n=1 Tax=Nicoliella spurrieriana TaxID=2925830 RepID=A0A976RS11_9LACO|nr:class I SAM-dependent methyltransferase [Nicoliella spurrieriana]